MFQTINMKRLALIAFLASSFLISACSDDDDKKEPGAKKPTIWKSGEITFVKESDADWTLPANQDKITDKVIITRQDAGPIYNYQWWQENYDVDATFDEINDNFWGNDEDELSFIPNGGVQGTRWAILDGTGGSTDAWDTFEFYGTLGDSTHFYSFHNVATMISRLESDNRVVQVNDDFEITYASEDDISTTTGTNMPKLVGKKLGVWLVEDDIYFTLEFTEWGSGGSNSSVAYKRTSKK